MKGFGQRLRSYREKRSLTQQDLAQAIGATVMMISRYERGIHLPTADKAVAICEVLHVTADALLRGDRNGEESVPFDNVRLFERMKILDRLPRSEQNTVLDVIDAVIARHEIKDVVTRRSAGA
ncbi:MAG: helix-turn-helix transcriptional regulator [Acidobacteria bacterium]|nr:helix-turn-helix transcriptional regulator [Acidobacteriota bacterium]